MGIVYVPLSTQYNYRRNPFTAAITTQAITELRCKVPLTANYWIQLRECPYGSLGAVAVTDADTAAALTEVVSAPADGQYRVDYANRTGLVEFHSAQAGVEMNIAYNGQGSPILAGFMNMPGLLGLCGGFGGTGALGDVTISADTPFSSAPRHYNSLTINNTRIVSPSGYGLILLVRETLTVSGVITASGVVGGAGAGSYAGGAGGATIIPGGHGADTLTAGSVGSCMGAAGGAGGTGYTANAGSAGGVGYLSRDSWSYLPAGTYAQFAASTNINLGSGGGGGGKGGSLYARGGGGGGGGGGFIYIECGVLIVNATGSIIANGGAGGTGVGGSGQEGGGGGGGGGGTVIIRAGRVESTAGTIAANGGAGGTGYEAGVTGTNGFLFYTELGALTG